MKFVRRQHADNAEMVARFRIEAEVTGRLDHPGVVPLYGMGESWDGRPCYAMRFIEGENLRTAIHDFRERDWKVQGRSAGAWNCIACWDTWSPPATRWLTPITEASCIGI